MSRLLRSVGSIMRSGFAASRAAMTLLLVVATLNAVAQVAVIVGVAHLVDAALSEGSGGVTTASLLIAVMLAVSVCGEAIEAALSHRVTDLVRLEVTARLANAVVAVDTIEHFEDATARRDLEVLLEGRRLLGNGPRELLRIHRAVVRLVALVLVLGTVHVALVVLPVFGVAPFLFDAAARRRALRATEELAEDRRLLVSLFELGVSARSAKEVRSYGWQAPLTALHRATASGIRRRADRAAIESALWTSAGWLVFALGYLGAATLVVLEASRGGVTAGQVLLVVSIGRQARGFLGELVSAWGEVGGAVEAEARLRRFAEVRPRSSDRQEPPARLERGIELAGVGFRYPGTDQPILRDVDLVLRAGTTVGVVGDNGAGKSTLVKLLSGMYEPTAGSILVDGVPLDAIDTSSWRRRTTAAFQQFVMFEVELGEVVGLGDLPRLDDADAVTDALDRAGGLDVVASVAGDLTTPLGSSQAGRDLSHGQWQKLALGRAMMREAPLLVLLDEPTASLDPVAERALFDRYAEHARQLAEVSGAITVLVSHRYSTVRAADLIVVVDGGRVIEAGSHDDLMARRGRYSELFSLQAAGYA